MVVMVTFVIKWRVKNLNLVIFDHYGVFWQKSNIGFLDNFNFQNNHPSAKKTTSSLLKIFKRSVSRSLAFTVSVRAASD